MQRTALKIVPGGREASENWQWFCGHCAAPSPGGLAPAPTARVCGHCGLGLFLETREDLVPEGRDAFLVVDAQLLVQAMSREAEKLLGLPEEEAVDRPVAELLVPADAEAGGPTGFAAMIADAAAGDDADHARAFVRPWNTFGVRMRARIATCGPPRAALVVLGGGPPPALRAVEGSGADALERPTPSRSRRRRR